MKKGTTETRATKAEARRRSEGKRTRQARSGQRTRRRQQKQARHARRGRSDDDAPEGGEGKAWERSARQQTLDTGIEVVTQIMVWPLGEGQTLGRREGAKPVDEQGSALHDGESAAREGDGRTHRGQANQRLGGRAHVELVAVSIPIETIGTTGIGTR